MWSREADAAARAARACATDAVSSTADSSATTSPARTRSPLLTLMDASWPPTSGATRTSVVRTTPMIGVASARRHRTYPTTPAATRVRPSAMPTAARLAMRSPPLDERCGNHRERKIDDGQAPQAAPVVHHLTKACAQLADADDAVDRKIRREYVTRSGHRRWDCFARPGKAVTKSCGRLVPRKMSVGLSGYLNQAP